LTIAEYVENFLTMLRLALFLLALVICLPSLGFGRVTLSEQDDSLHWLGECEEIRDSQESHREGAEFKYWSGSTVAADFSRGLFAIGQLLRVSFVANVPSTHFSRPPPA
jgi:hypothetical protein